MHHSVAIQSGGDTNINQGLTTVDVRAIVEAVADQIPKYTAIAAAIVDQRLKDFEEKIVGRFEADQEANSNAFKEPDFQYLLGRAQHAYARSGEEAVGESLAELISERSKAPNQSRLALSINGAVERVPLLTREEFAELSLSFLIRQVGFPNITTPAELGRILRKFADPLLDDVSDNQNSYTYLESLGCGKLSLASARLEAALGQRYRFLQTGRLLSEVQNATSAGFTQSLIDAGLATLSNGRVRHVLSTIDEFRASVEGAALDTTFADAAWNAAQGEAVTAEEMISVLAPHAPRIKDLFRLWNDTPIKSFELSAVGLVIGFSNLTRVSEFKEDLTIWVN